MPNKCAVPGCKTGYASCKVTFPTFATPKNDTLREKWQKSLQLSKPLTVKHFVCAKHFHPKFIIGSHKVKDESGNVLTEVPLKRVRLETNAVPTTLPLQNSIQQQPPSSNGENLQVNKNIMEKKPDPAPTLHASTKNCNSPTFVQPIQTPMVLTDSENKLKADIEDTTVQTQKTATLLGHDLFAELLRTPTLIQIPANWHLAMPLTKKYIVLYELLLNNEDPIYPITRRSLTINNDMKINFSAKGRRVNLSPLSFPDKFDNLETINRTLAKFASLNVCCGISVSDDVNFISGKIAYIDNSNQLRHNQCPIVIDKRRCEACTTTRKSVFQRKLRLKKRDPTGVKKMMLRQETASELCKKTLCRQQRALNRAKNKIVLLKNVMRSQQAKMNNLEKVNVLQRCEELGIPDGQKICINEIMAAAQKKNSKGHRYTDEWIMLCVLMHMRSSSAYEFLRKNKVLPVPCIKTIRRYLSVIDMECEENEEPQEKTSQEL